MKGFIDYKAIAEHLKAEQEENRLGYIARNVKYPINSIVRVAHKDAEEILRIIDYKIDENGSLSPRFQTVETKKAVFTHNAIILELISIK